MDTGEDQSWVSFGKECHRHSWLWLTFASKGYLPHIRVFWAAYFCTLPYVITTTWPLVRVRNPWTLGKIEVGFLLAPHSDDVCSMQRVSTVDTMGAIWGSVLHLSYPDRKVVEWLMCSSSSINGEILPGTPVPFPLGTRSESPHWLAVTTNMAESKQQICSQ